VAGGEGGGEGVGCCSCDGEVGCCSCGGEVGCCSCEGEVGCCCSCEGEVGCCCSGVEGCSSDDDDDEGSCCAGGSAGGEGGGEGVGEGEGGVGAWLSSAGVSGLVAESCEGPAADGLGTATGSAEPPSSF
jgi:hypothetical protein